MENNKTNHNFQNVNEESSEVKVIVGTSSVAYPQRKEHFHKLH